MSSSTENGTHPLNSKIITKPTTSAPRCWGSFQYRENGKNQVFKFTKAGNDGESGVGGYVFGRREDCDFVLPVSPIVSGRHFLIYKEMVHDPETKMSVERVFLKDFSTNGTFINNVKVGVNRRVQLKHLDNINYLYEARKDKDRCRFVFIEGEPAEDLTFESQYILGMKLGSGNFATVYKATSRKTGEEYAVKIVKKNASFNAKVEASLEREIGILMSIDHENLLRICQVFHEPKLYYVVTELAEGGELFDQIIDKQKFTESETRHIFKQVLSGVKYLHDQGVVHRDLKPENILVMDVDTMRVKISDFGLAKMIGTQMFVNTVCGTPSYVAPEIIRNGEYGRAVDMWSLGVILYICLCGFPPFSDDLAPPKLRHQVLQSMYTFPSPYWDSVSDEAVDLVQGLLAQDVTARLTVDEALEHVWMTMEDEDGTFPNEPRTEAAVKHTQLLSRVMTERADRAIMRGIRVGYSQPTPFSQTYADLIDEDEDDDGDDKTRVGDHYRSSGIGIFSQEGMVRGTGMDTDSEDDGEPLKPVKRPLSNSDKAEEEESDRSYMTVQDTFNGKTDTHPGVADEDVVSMAISVTDRESEADANGRVAKRPRV
ncbi:serine/threonine-protein kinase CHEK2 [Entomortierella parvispora]|uniref:Serine/threonine-protein kinase CHEK2 n=1 Tax=Entomortierella parvispora TaxID=205924 RepID=A0A9P3HKF9_9FUNG|nr:serine/threonine-protein kinase CHEK2 [Entomortierella parvispora]